MQTTQQQTLLTMPKVSGTNIIARSSLFWMDGNKIESTWDYLARNKGGARNTRMVNKQIKYKCNTMTFIIFHASDPDCNCNPFVGSPNAAQIMAGQNAADLAEVARWSSLLEAGRDPNVILIPCLFCGDDVATTQNTRFTDWFAPLVVQWLHPYSKGFLIATEASKSNPGGKIENVQWQERLITKMREGMSSAGLSVLPIGVHNQGTKIAGNADFLAYEFSWHPSVGHDIPVSTVVAEARDTLRKSPCPVWFQEITMNVESSRALEQVRALIELGKTEQKLIGIPGPAYI